MYPDWDAWGGPVRLWRSPLNGAQEALAPGSRESSSPPGGNLRSVSVVAKEFGAERVFVRALQDWNFQCLLKRKECFPALRLSAWIMDSLSPNFSSMGIGELVSSFCGGHEMFILTNEFSFYFIRDSQIGYQGGCGVVCFKFTLKN